MPRARALLMRFGLLTGMALACALPTAAQSPEFRAMWISRFEWPDLDPNTCRARIDNMMATLQAARFNAVFFQVRGQADVLYPSPEETWSPLLDEVNPGWDPLAYAIQSAHLRGIEFHAYINSHTCWQSDPASAHTLPANPNHIFYQHCNAADPAHRDWLHHATASNPVQFNESDYVWFAPGVPAYQTHFRRQAVYVAANYDVDGIHFDRIRTPGGSLPSYDPISQARYASPQSNPDNLNLTRWTADQVTRLVTDVYAAVALVNPNVAMSAAVFPEPNSAPSAQHQDAKAWAARGGLDVIVPMMYSTGGVGSLWDSRLQNWLSGASGRLVVAGQITSEGVTSLVEQINLTRTRGAAGNSVFSYTSFSWWDAYATGVYATSAVLPAMPWKSNPTTGFIYGYVTDPNGAPIVDAQVWRDGAAYKALSCTDGFYSLLQAPPGNVMLTAQHNVYGGAVLQNATVQAGAATRRDFVLGGALPPVIVEVTPNPSPAYRGQEYRLQLGLAQGLATSWELLSGPSGAVISNTGLVSGWQPTNAESGALLGFSARATNGMGSDDVAWTALVTPTAPCARFSITGFEDYAAGAAVLFRLPRFSGSTSQHLATTPNVSAVTDAVTPFAGANCHRLEWAFLDASPSRWVRITTNNAANVPNPTVELHRPIRMRIRLDSGRLRVCAGVRETGTTAELGANGGTSGTIEWIGAASAISGAPQGRPIEPMPGVWQTFVFDPLADPVLALTGDGQISSPNNRGVLEQLAFTAVDSAGPFVVYVDDVELLCDAPLFGDYDQDGELTAADFAGISLCLWGPDVVAGGTCAVMDADGDADVDLADLWALQSAIGG